MPSNMQSVKRKMKGDKNGYTPMLGGLQRLFEWEGSLDDEQRRR